MNIKETLDNLYGKTVGLEHKQVAYCLYDIIQLKMVAPELMNYNNTFYKDIKGFIHHYILAVELEGYGYDSVSINKVLSAIRFLSEYDEKSKLLQFTYLKLHKAGFDEEVDFIKSEQKKILIQSVIHSDSYVVRLKALLYCCFYNVWTILLISLVLIGSYYIITLPLLDESEAWFINESNKYDDNLYLNHVANILGSTFGFNNDVYCQPTTFGTEMILIFYKVMGSLIVFGCLLKYLGRYFYLKIFEYED